MPKVAKIAWMALFVMLQLVDVTMLDPRAFNQAQAQPSMPTVSATSAKMMEMARLPAVPRGQTGGGLMTGECHDGCHGLHFMTVLAAATSMHDGVGPDRGSPSRHPWPAKLFSAPPVPPPNS